MQTDDFSSFGSSSTTVPLIDFTDVDRDSMPDMVFFRDSAVHTFFNKYSANPASELNLCKQPTDTKYLVNNEIFAKFSQVGKDNKVSPSYLW